MNNMLRKENPRESIEGNNNNDEKVLKLKVKKILDIDVLKDEDNEFYGSPNQELSPKH